jgi:hypothetical protein
MAGFTSSVIDCGQGEQGSGTCQYKFKRGMLKDQFCSKPAIPGSQYCQRCDKLPADRKQPWPEPKYLIEHDSEHNVDYEVITRFIVRRITSSLFEAIGILCDGEAIFILSQSEKDAARQMGFLVNE